LIQKFVLLLGHPTYALTVIIFSMLISSGLGSFYSKRIVKNNPERLRIVLLLIVILVPVLGYFAGLVSDLGPAWPLAVKMLITVLVIAPLGFLMGIPFPTGLATLEGWDSSAVRWGWSMNAASSVLGSAMAIFFAIYLGLYQTLVLGGLLYLVAAWIYRSTAERATHEQASV
jgi:predicted membrane-bound spermidine synthase